MKYTKHIPAILLGVLFVVFGANYFLNFIPNPPMTGKPLEFMNLFGQTGYMGFVKVVEIICGVLDRKSVV